MLECKVTSEDVRKYIRDYINNKNFNSELEVDEDSLAGVLVDKDFTRYNYGEEITWYPDINSFMYPLYRKLYDLYTNKIQEIDLVDLFKHYYFSQIDIEGIDVGNIVSYMDNYLKLYFEGLSEYGSMIELYWINSLEYENDDYIAISSDFFSDIVSHYVYSLTSKVQKDLDANNKCNIDDEFSEYFVFYTLRMIKIAENLDDNLNRQLEYYQSENGQKEIERCLALGLANPLKEIEYIMSETEGQIFQNIILDNDLKIVENEKSWIYEKYCDEEILGKIEEMDNER